MPVMDGFEACSKIKIEPSTKQIPVIILTALKDRQSRIKALEAGANDFLTKPIDSTELIVRVKNLLQIKDYWDYIKNYNSILENEVKSRTEELNNTLESLRESDEKLRDSYQETIFRLTVVAEYKDQQTAAHIKRVGEYCSLIAEQLGWSDDDINTIRYASPLHDIGKTGIPTDILLKTSKLNYQEFELMKTHTVIGADILKYSQSKFLKMGEKIALTHHESWDGSGYPNGLKGEKINIEGRIMKLADIYDSLRSERPYKPPFDHGKAFKIISEGDGRTKISHFDPRVLEIFKDNNDKFDNIFKTEVVNE
jgi:putative two-component system response regulator